jgi:hypothetical protein
VNCTIIETDHVYSVATQIQAAGDRSMRGLVNVVAVSVAHQSGKEVKVA